MKTYIYKTIFLWLLMSSYLIHSQRPYNNRNRYRNFKVKKIRQKKGRGEYLRFYSLKYMKKPATEDVRDFNFNWGNNFDGAFRNLALVEQAQKAQIMEWYRRQFNLIKDEIGKHLNKSFNNYDQAKEAFFSDIETKNINKNKPALISKYEKLYIPGRNKNRKYLKELKYIQLREVEIRAGNINNSQFPYLKAKGILLKNITSLSKLSEFRYDFENAFGNQISKNLEYVYTIEKLEYLGSSFDNEMLQRKHKYYDSFSKWDQLGLMQFLLNLEHIKKLMNCQVCLVPNELRKFMNSDMATEDAIEEYAINNRNKSLSIFDPRYPQVHRFKYQNNFCGGPIDLMAWEADKKVALDKLLDDVSIREILAQSLVTELNITDNSQKNWLYSSSNSNEVSNLSDFLQNNRVHGVVAVEAMNFAKEVIKAKESNNYTNLFNSTLFTQNPYNVWKTLTQAEKNLIKQNWSEAYHIYKNRKVAEDATRQKFNRNGLNDKSDAFRHAYYNAINAKVVGVDIAKLFSDAHESETPIRFIKEKRMDLFNNNVGHQSLLLNSNLSLTQLVDLIYQKLLNGDLRYLKPINYNDPNFGYTHGITVNTLLKPTNQ